MERTSVVRVLGLAVVSCALSGGFLAAPPAYAAFNLATGGSVDLYSHVDYYPNPMIAQHAGTDSYNGDYISRPHSGMITRASLFPFIRPSCRLRDRLRHRLRQRGLCDRPVPVERWLREPERPDLR